MEHSHRTAIVTGGSRGLGRALVRILADQGWRVVTDGRDVEALERAVGDRERVVAVPGDVTDPQHRRRLVDTAVEVGGGIDLLVNNAGGLGPSPLPGLAEYPLDELADLFTVNVVAPLGLIQMALPSLLTRDAASSSTSRRTPLSRRTRVGVGTARRRRPSITSGECLPSNTPSCGCSPSTPATCGRRCTRTPFLARTSRIVRCPRRRRLVCWR